MNLILTRNTRTEQSTIGDLSIDGVFECYILEDVEREVKIHGKTAIPKGTYEITVTFSNRFQKPLPLLLNVPGFYGIRIHPGNTAADTEGCLLPGSGKLNDKVINSRLAFGKLFTKIKAGLKTGKVYITIQ